MTKNKIYDVITYNGEKELFDLRYNILKDYVDEFIVVGFDKSFSGKERKPFEIETNLYPKAKFIWIKEDNSAATIGYNKYKDLALSSPNTQYGKGAEHWIREFCQKESIKDCLIRLKDDDIVFVGDTDEIVEPSYYQGECEFPIKFKLRVYTYWLNNRSNEEFWGTLRAKYKDIKDNCLNHLRNGFKKTDYEAGWHFTSLKDNLRQKLTDSYTEETYANKWVLDNLDKNIAENKDFLGRNFTYKVDESEWPKYLKENREKYKHLLRKE